ncbi:MAG TPA: ATP-binding protein [Chroococcidiopsis sp.]
MDSSGTFSMRQEHRVLESLAALSYRAGDLESYLDEIASGVSRLIQSDWSIVTICEGEAGRVLANSLGRGLSDCEFSTHGTLVAEVVQTGRSLIIEDIRTESRSAMPPDGYLCYLGIPLKTPTGDVIGTICSFLRQPRQFSEAEVRMVELFAERAAIAIDNYRLYHQQQQFNERLEREVATRTEELRISQATLIERERLAAIGEFTAMIVHELRNPLTTVELGLRYAHRKLSETGDPERLAIALSESARLKHLLNEILLYAKPQELKRSQLNLTRFLQDLLGQLREMPEASDRHITLTSDRPDVEIVGDVDKLTQVFINLIRNAAEAIAAHETVRCQITAAAQPDQICVHIHNGGDPIPAEILPKLTTPFCSTKPSGTGLGLAIVKRIVMAHGGDLAIASDLETGTTVSVCLAIAPVRS